MGEHAVVSERYPEGGEQVERRHHAELERPHGAVPEQDDGRDERGRWQADPDQVYELVCPSHKTILSGH